VRHCLPGDLQQRHSIAAPVRWRLAIVALFALAFAASAPAAADAGPPAEPLQIQTLLLEASVNGRPQGLILHLQVENGRFRITPSDLREVGVEAGDLPVDAQGRIGLDDVPGLRHVYRREAQQIDLIVEDRRLIAERLGYSPPPVAAPQPAIGFVLNYDTHLQLQSTRVAAEIHRSTALTDYAARSLFTPPSALSAAAPAPFDLGQNPADRFSKGLGVYTDSRLFSPWGTLRNGGFAVLTDDPMYERARWIRTDTNWTYNDPSVPRTYLAGDFISSSLWGSRSVRLGGLQLRSDFELRPDLLTYPLPIFGGSALVPSAVDLYINNLRQFSGQAGGGPFVIDTPPAITGAGNAMIVVEDPFGRRVVVTLPIYVDTRLLREGVNEYAIEAGYFRHNFGAVSSDYGSQPAFSGTYRRGVSDGLTLGLRGEAITGMANASLGAQARLGQFGVLGATLGGSSGSSDSTRGKLGIIDYRYIAPWGSVSFSQVQADHGYRDLAAVDGAPFPRHQQFVVGALSLPHAQQLSASFYDIDAGKAGRSSIVALSYSVNIGSRVNLFAQTYDDRQRANAWGLYLGVSVNLNERINVFANTSKFADGTMASVGASRSVDFDAGGFGWGVQADASGDGSYRHALARGNYLGRRGEVQASVEAFRDANVLMLDGRGALVVMDGTVKAARSIGSGFALVSTDGIAGVPVLRENRRIGVTDGDGRFIVPDLIAFNTNRLAIDTTELPVDARIEVDRLEVVPAYGAGVLARFPISRFRGASLALVDGQGRPLPVGGRVTLRESGRSALLGYDGLVFFEALEPMNHLLVEFGGRRCTVNAPFDPAQAMGTIGPLVCVPEEAAP